jgi:pyruvate formate lyase activating enzyme
VNARPSAYTSRPPGDVPRADGPGRPIRDAAQAILSVEEPDGEVRCVACAHRCLVRPGRLGICRVRENRDGRLVSLVYGRAVATAVEPIEKKPLFHAWPGSLTYSIATRGCNFHCSFCQNWEIAQADREGFAPPSSALPPRSVVAAALAVRARSIAYTYVEPTVFIEYVVDSARLAHEAGLANVIVTNGYQTPEALDVLAPLIDAANVDLKAFDDRFYRRVCGARLAPVLATLVGLRRRGVWIEVTTLVIPGLNDDPEGLAGLARWIAAELGPETPWHVSRFFPAYRLSSLAPTPLPTIRLAVEIGRDAGLRHVYAGNVGDLEGDETRCATCGEVLIRRHGFGITEDRLAAGGCPRCGAALAGIGLAEEPGR